MDLASASAVNTWQAVSIEFNVLASIHELLNRLRIDKPAGNLFTIWENRSSEVLPSSIVHCEKGSLTDLSLFIRVSFVQLFTRVPVNPHGSTLDPIVNNL